MIPSTNRKILDLIYTSVMSEGGDGDAIWLTKHTSLDDILELIKSYNLENKIDWEITIEQKHLSWGSGHEWVLITNDEEFFKSQPSWITLKINY